MARGVKTITSNFVCPECGMVMPLPRFCGQQRRKNHIKDIWCPMCKTERKFQEIKNRVIRNLAGELI